MKSNNAFLTLIICIFILAMNVIATPVWAGSDHHHSPSSNPDSSTQKAEKGPNNGRLFRDGEFTLELQLHENGTPPEYRVFITNEGQSVALSQVALDIQLTRLGGIVDHIKFSDEGDYLRGDTVIREPHSFVVTLTARYKGKDYHWHFDNFEGRTQINAKLAQQMNITTGIVGPQKLTTTVPVYGRLALPAGAKRQISARFDGEITAMPIQLGNTIKKGQHLLTIQSNDSLQNYRIKSPIDGIITVQNSAVGEQTNGRVLLEVTNTSELMAELEVFPSQVQQIKIGANASLSFDQGETTYQGQIKDTLFGVSQSQAKIMRVPVPNPTKQLHIGQFVTANVASESFTAPLAIKLSALQTFRDFNVVYAKFGEQYEVRMLELGKQAGDWVEVLGGIEPGTQYVIDNSYILKADIEKSGASHDH